MDALNCFEQLGLQKNHIFQNTLATKEHSLSCGSQCLMSEHENENYSAFYFCGHIPAELWKITRSTLQVTRLTGPCP